VAYLEAYIDFVKPKLILSRTDNNHTLWQLKRRPNVTYKVALVQNGWRIADSPGGETGKIDAQGDAHIDYFFSFGMASQNAFRSDLKSTFIPIGSLNLNFFPKHTSALNCKKSVSLVSIFRNKTRLDDQGIKEFGGLEQNLLKRGLDFSVILRSESQYECTYEEYFYEVAMPNLKKEFLKRSSRYSSYVWLTRKNIILFDMSTLGYEALGLGLRVGFVSFQQKFRNTDRFGKPLEFGEKGPFWTNDPSEEEIGRILDYLLSVSDEQWERDSGWIRDQLMVHDYGNTKIRAYVEGVLTDSLESK
jgi:surface carbohydrate biosynthesis protein